jgi:hypothetical protein
MSRWVRGGRWVDWALLVHEPLVPLASGTKRFIPGTAALKGPRSSCFSYGPIRPSMIESWGSGSLAFMSGCVVRHDAHRRH